MCEGGRREGRGLCTKFQYNDTSHQVPFFSLKLPFTAFHSVPELTQSLTQCLSLSLSLSLSHTHSTPHRMAELHIIGQVIGATDFPSSHLSCKYQFVAGDDWSLLEGQPEGQTQVDLPRVRNHRLTIYLPG